MDVELLPALAAATKRLLAAAAVVSVVVVVVNAAAALDGIGWYLVKNEEQDCQMQVLEKFAKSAICYVASLETYTTLNLRNERSAGNGHHCDA